MIKKDLDWQVDFNMQMIYREDLEDITRTDSK